MLTEPGSDAWFKEASNPGFGKRSRDIIFILATPTEECCHELPDFPAELASMNQTFGLLETKRKGSA